MHRRNARLPIDVLIENNTVQQNIPSTYIKKWKDRMKEAFGIAATHIKSERDMEKRKMDQKPRLQPFEAGCRVLVTNLNERGEPGKTKTFWEQKVLKIFKKKDAVSEKSNPHA